jgi:hypothetical protein
VKLVAPLVAWPTLAGSLALCILRPALARAAEAAGPLEALPTTALRGWWNTETSARWALVLALLALALLQLNQLLAARGRPETWQRARRIALGAIGVVSFATYFNMGAFHFPNYVHNWDVFHYFVGAKYFKELSYGRLYECTAVADLEDARELPNPGLLRRVERRTLRNLSTNVLEPAAAVILGQPERCKQHFASAERWRDFRQDVRYFRARLPAQRWEEAQADHGYNATPVWGLVGSLLANTAPATNARILLLTLLDPAYLVGAAALVWWAFGWRVLCVALVVFATNFPSRFSWTGGAFLRWDWLFYSVAAVCCLRKDRPLLGGLALGYAALLRLFPVFLFIGPALALGWRAWKYRALDRTCARFLAGGAAAAALLVPLSLPLAGGPQAYVEFVRNTQKHAETPLTNAMGLQPLITFTPWEAGNRITSDAVVEPWSKWKQAKVTRVAKTKWLHYGLVVVYLAALGYAVRRTQPWVAAALSTSFCAIGASLTSYYYAFVLVVALLYEEREEIGRILLACTAFTQFIAWAPIGNGWLDNEYVQMSRWIDEQHMLYSLGTVIAFVLILWCYVTGARVSAAASNERRRQITLSIR